MKCFKGFLQKIDIFGVPYTFKHKNNEKYGTSLGGFILILFIIAVFVIGIYYFIPFYNRKNFSIIYYSMNMPITDTIQLSESKANFAIGLACPLEAKTQVSGKDLFDLKLTYIVYTTDHNGIKTKVKHNLSTHQCNYADFYNEYNDTFDFMSLSQFECLDKIDNSIQGIYTDEVFRYYEFSVVSKNDSVELFRTIDKYLTEQDCRLELYYTDITIDLNNYNSPIKPYINSVFIQLNPTLFLKMNVYFKNQYFNDDNFLLFVFDEEEEKTTIHTLFSRLEDYSLYKGLNRGVDLPYNNINYANIYIRADTSKTIIKRKYQKVMEFYADSSSMLIALFELLYIVFCFVNRFYADHSLAKRIFFFKEAKNRHFDINRKSYKIKNLIKLLDPLIEKKNILLNINDNKNQTTSKNYDDNKNQTTSKNYDDNKNQSITRNNDDNNDIEINDLDEGIKVYNINRNVRNKENLSKINEILKPNDFRKFPNKRVRNKMNRKIKFAKDEDYEENFKNISTIHSTKRNIMNRYKIQPVKISTMSFKGLKENEHEKIKFEYNIFEIFWFYLCLCCMTNNLKAKKNLTEKSNNILNKKLDISLYIKNTILIDILNQALINDSMKSMTKFISRPIISLNKKGDRDMNQFYKNYEITDFENLYSDVSDLSKKPRLTQAEQKIISLVCGELNEMI